MTAVLRETVCAHTHIVENSGERVCSQCGLVLGPVLVSNARRASHVVLQVRPHRATSRSFKLKPFHMWPKYRGWRERRLAELSREVDRISVAMGLSRGASERVRWMLRKLVGKSRVPSVMLLADLVYVACRSLRCPRTFKEIDGAFFDLYGEKYRRRARGRMSNAYKIANRFGFQMHVPIPADFIDRLAWERGGAQVAARAHSIVELKKTDAPHVKPMACARFAVETAIEEFGHREGDELGVRGCT